MSEYKWLTKPEITYIKRHPRWIKMEPINRLLADGREMREIVRCLVDPGASQDEAIWALDEARAMLDATK